MNLSTTIGAPILIAIKATNPPAALVMSALMSSVKPCTTGLRSLRSLRTIEPSTTRVRTRMATPIVAISTGSWIDRMDSTRTRRPPAQIQKAWMRASWCSAWCSLGLITCAIRLAATSTNESTMPANKTADPVIRKAAAFTPSNPKLRITAERVADIVHHSFFFL